MDDNRFKLCYVSGSWAYFTTQDLEKQWGDDWNDAPYEHNAGSPYRFGERNRERGEEPWEIKEVAFDGPLETPADRAWSGNSHYSVQQINAGSVAWLSTDAWVKKPVVIPAGTSLPDFIRLVHEAGGDVYMPVPKEAG
ncbi:MAG TPA: hypothetical protein VEC96_02480 [Anaerolineae bacterium]|nr:hypothetical protein [Anaerolineae bacterium]